jgi:hypothetical protein
MRKTTKTKKNGMRAEYNFAKLKGGVRGKYLERYRAGTNLVLPSPDVAAFFPDARSVNAALPPDSLGQAITPALM